MIQVDVHQAVSAACTAESIALVSSIESAIGRRPLSDQAWIDLHDSSGERSVALHARHDRRLVGHAQLGRTDLSWSMELVMPADLASADRDGVVAALVTAALDSIAHRGGGTVSWWMTDPDDASVRLAESMGLQAGRTLHQMRVDLPLDAAAVGQGRAGEVAVRPFVVGQDEDAWLDVNNAAFAGHPEQGGWDRAILEQRITQDWFDPSGFLVHEREGRIGAFCWTKLHSPTAAEPHVLGEIYVIAVHPDLHGLGLGRALTVVGLVSIAARGVRTGLLYVDGDNPQAMALYRSLGFSIHRTDRTFDMTIDPAPTPTATAADLPRWSVTDVHESMTARSFVDALETMTSDIARLEAAFDDAGIRAVQPRPATADDADATARVLSLYNVTAQRLAELEAYVYATVSTDSRDERAQALLSEISTSEARVTPLLARLADWVHALGVEDLAGHDHTLAEHAGPLLRLSERSDHQMSEGQENLFAELATTGSSAWSRLHADVTSQLTTDVSLPDGTVRMPMPAVRGLATHPDLAVRRAAYDAEMEAWPRVATTCAAALNAIKGEANTVNRRRNWASPLDASLFANSVSHATFDAMQAAVTTASPKFREWMRCKARLHGHQGGLPWWDLMAPLPVAPGQISWDEGIGLVRHAFTAYSPALADVVDRAIGEQWLDAEPRDGKEGGAFCMPFVDDRSLVLLNWSGSVESAQTTAHELGHAYHNVQLAHRTALQRRLPMALAETASIFCETLVVEAGLGHLQGLDRLALLDVDLIGSTQVVLDIQSRLLFETDVFARRQRRTIGVSEFDEMMLSAQADAYGDGLDQSTAHPHMWAVKPHYYFSHFYNWPYTYGLLFGLGLFAKYREDPERFQSSYDDVLSRAGMNTAEELGASFGLDVSDQSFWDASLSVIADRIDQYGELATQLGLP